MASRYAPRRPPPTFVPLSPPRWRALCEVLEQNPLSRELTSGGRMIGWRAPRLWYVDPSAYRDLMGAWPPGYFPEG